jgi:nitroreductase
VSALDAVRRRRSYSKVTETAPTHEDLIPFVEAVSSVADHSGLKPWRLIELRGDARERLGAAFAAASGLVGKDAEKLAAKPMRASLLIAVVATIQPSFKVPAWEQEAVASGVAHLLSLVLDEAGWGVFWRTGGHTRAAEVHIMHGLAENELLLGWLYVGGKPDRDKGDKPRKPFAPLTAV